LQSLQKAADDLGDISEKKILKAIREYGSGRNKLPVIAVAAPRKGNAWSTDKS